MSLISKSRGLLMEHEYEIPTIDEERYLKLFEGLDINADGRIDVHDLSEGMKRLGIPALPGHAQAFISKADTNKDSQLDFSEFVRFVSEHEKKLYLVFKNLDRDQDGHIDATEIINGFKHLGITIHRKEAENIVNRMDKDGTLKVDWNEWKNFLMFNPASDMRGILKFWRHSSFIDIGDDMAVPDEFTEDEIQTGAWWRILVSGGVAGAVSRTCTAPLDRLKVLLQVHATKSNQLGIVTGFKNMIEEGGIKSLWRGNGTNVLKIAPESAIKFMAYEQFKKVFSSNSSEGPHISQRFIAGSLAGAVSQTIIYPMEVLKTRLALRKTGQYTGMFDCARKILAKEGVRSFYKGYVPNLIGIIPYAGIDLGIYETLKTFYLQKHPDEPNPGIVVLLACGTTSSTCGQLASYPLALIRTRMQAQAAISDSSVQLTMFGLFKTIIKEEGVFGLYRGLAPNFMKVAPAVSISYVVYENIKRIIGSK